MYVHDEISISPNHKTCTDKSDHMIQHFRSFIDMATHMTVNGAARVESGTICAACGSSM